MKNAKENATRVSLPRYRVVTGGNKGYGKSIKNVPPDHPMVARLRGVMNDDGRRDEWEKMLI